MSTYRGQGIPANGDNFPSNADLEAAVIAAQASADAAAASASAAQTAQTGAELAETNAETAETGAVAAQTLAETAQTAAELAETNAEAAETGAAASASAASTSETNAAASESAASTSATAAAGSATAAAGSASAAATSETNAGSSASASAASAAAAATSETNAGTSETNAAASESAASTSATASAASEALATTAATDAEAAEVAAVAAQGATELTYDEFDDRYLGDKTSDPTLDNDGDALLEGAMYWNSVSKLMKVYTGIAWTTFGVGGDLVDDTTPQLGGDLDVQGYKITTATLNGDVLISPNGTGCANIDNKLKFGDWGGVYHGMLDPTGAYIVMFHPSSHTHISTATTAGDVYIRARKNGTAGQLIVTNGNASVNGGTVWTSVNDGAGSGLDADLLDGRNLDVNSTIYSVAQRNSGGDLICRLIRSDYTAANTTGNYYVVQNSLGVGADNYHRPITKANARTDLKTTYGGRVTSGGAWAYNPEGWTVSRISTGRFRVTHNKGWGGSCAVALSMEENASWDRQCKVALYSTNYFEVVTTNSTNGYANLPFAFVLYKL